jgi:hypothetical protein
LLHTPHPPNKPFFLLIAQAKQLAVQEKSGYCKNQIRSGYRRIVKIQDFHCDVLKV